MYSVLRVFQFTRTISRSRAGVAAARSAAANCGISVVCGVYVSGTAAEANVKQKAALPAKIALLIADVGTIDTVAGTEEFLTQIKKVSNTEANMNFLMIPIPDIPFYVRVLMLTSNILLAPQPF